MIGEDIRAKVFRNTNDFYKTFPAGAVSEHLVAFTRRFAGMDVLDFGCAAGNYCVRLAQLGYNMKGVDVNAEYVRMAREKGVDAHVVTDKAPFADRSFDTVLVYEVVEHLPDPSKVILEAKRLARKNVLFTTPHSGEIAELQSHGLLLEHFADLDHKNFFDEASLSDLLKPYFSRVTVWKGDGINPFVLFTFRPIRWMGRLLIMLRLLKPRYHFRLYAVAEV